MRAAVVVCALALAGCASGGGREEADTTSTATASTRIASEPPPPTVALPHPRTSQTALGVMRKLAAERAYVSRRLTDAAADLSALPPTVFCWDERDWRRVVTLTNRELPPNERGEFDGLADLYSFEIHLAPWVCRTLEALPRRPADDLELAGALGVFTHETRHLTSAGSNEGAAECAGLQKIPAAAVALGLDEQTGKAMARRAWRELYPLLPAEYRSSQCSPGGGLDQEPETPSFP